MTEKIRTLLMMLDERYEKGLVDDATYNLVNDIVQLTGVADDSNLPRTYAEIEYADVDSIEAHDGMRFDDMNYLRYMER